MGCSCCDGAISCTLRPPPISYMGFPLDLLKHFSSFPVLPSSCFRQCSLQHSPVLQSWITRGSPVAMELSVPASSSQPALCCTHRRDLVYTSHTCIATSPPTNKGNILSRSLSGGLVSCNGNLCLVSEWSYHGHGERDGREGHGATACLSVLEQWVTTRISTGAQSSHPLSAAQFGRRYPEHIRTKGVNKYVLRVRKDE